MLQLLFRINVLDCDVITLDLATCKKQLVVERQLLKLQTSASVHDTLLFVLLWDENHTIST